MKIIKEMNLYSSEIAHKISNDFKINLKNDIEIKKKAGHY
jgi:hypothetical protein